jgi:hypothetical protein
MPSILATSRNARAAGFATRYIVMLIDLNIKTTCHQLMSSTETSYTAAGDHNFMFFHSDTPASAVFSILPRTLPVTTPYLKVALNIHFPSV